MKLHVQFFAQLRDLAATPELDVDLAEGSTIAELLEKIYEQSRRFARMTKVFWSAPAWSLSSSIIDRKPATRFRSCRRFKAGRFVIPKREYAEGPLFG